MTPTAPAGTTVSPAVPSNVEPTPSPRWHCLPLSQVPALTLYGVLALRSRVFVVEQQCIYQDPDGIDPQALLVWASLPVRAGLPVRVGQSVNVEASAEVIATARLLPAGVRFQEPSIGRVCISPLHRRQGLGRMLMEFSIGLARQHHPDLPIRISAQAYLQRFYESLGFVVASAPYLEDAIPHLEMRLAPG